MNITDLKIAIKYIMDSDSKLVPYAEGVPGLGKSDIVREIAKERAFEQKLPFYEGPDKFNAEEFGLIDLRLNQLEPSDLTGIPIPVNGEVEMTSSPFIPKFGQGILFIDELRQSPTQNISLASQLLLDRRVGTHKLGDGWEMVVASNRITDRASAHRMPTHVANRLHHLTLEFDLDSFTEYLHREKLPEVGIAYANWEPDVLTSFDPKREVNCTPRSYVSALSMLNAPANIRFNVIASCIGDGPAATLLGFVDVWKELPDLKLIIGDPLNCPLPQKSDAKFATTHMMSFNVTVDNFGTMIKYLERFNSAEYVTMLVTAALQKSPELGTTKEFDDYIDKNANILA